MHLSMNRNITIVVSVLVLHAAALWALQTGLLRRMTEILVPPEILVEIMSAPAAPLAPAVLQPAPKALAKASPAPPAQPPARIPVPAAAPLAVAQPSTATQATTAPAAPTATPTTAASTATPVATANAGPQSNALSNTPTATAPKLELPSSDADYLNNPRPSFPPLSKRLGEQGKVIIHTLIGADGLAQKAEIKKSSGFDRLDQAALATALKWRYVPGKRSGVAEAMWFDVPFNWVLE